MPNAEPKLIKVKIIQLWLEGTPEQVIVMVEEARETAIANGYTELNIEHEQAEYDTYYESNLYGKRMENKQEANARAEREARDIAQREAWDRRKFEELKKKFGN